MLILENIIILDMVFDLIHVEIFYCEIEVVIFGVDNSFSVNGDNIKKKDI